jgi:hypothetical protein
MITHPIGLDYAVGLSAAAAYTIFDSHERQHVETFVFMRFSFENERYQIHFEPL